jgi:hypothetical protein
MNKLDRLVWAREVSFIAYGVRVGVRVNHASIFEEVIKRLPPGSKRSPIKIVDHLYSVIAGVKPGSKRRGLSLAYWNSLKIGRSRKFDEVLDSFESHVQLTVAEHAPRRVFVHAGVVGWKGRAIVIPGTSFSGKTTLVERLIRGGATYYSDEYAVLDERGRVHAYARPLGMRTPNSSKTSSKSKRVTAAEIGARVGARPLPIHLVLSTNYKAGSKWRPKSITLGHGVLELLANTVSVRNQPDLAFTVLPKAVASAQILKGVRGDADAIVDSILELVG